MNRRTFWPAASREAFYVNGTYEARVPAGRYDLVVARGPEYRVHRQAVTVEQENTTAVAVFLNRYDDLPRQGWYSGESHLHLRRDRVADDAVWAQVAAEDLHIAHLLEMGNIIGTYFKQPAWGKQGRFERDEVALVSGQEDPRTVMRGHTIHWNVDSHNTEIWYSFLNLGFKVLPAGGADFPYFGPTLPGVERTYVKVEGPFTTDSWVEGFRRGRTYVTNGPFLDFTVNGRQMGEEIRVTRGARLHIVAAAQLNPDIDTLDRLELVVLGDVGATEPARGDRVRLNTTLTADHSMWIAVRAYGGHQEPQFTTVAHGAPIYVVVDNEPTWKAEAVEELVRLHRRQLNDLLTVPIDADGDLEAYETRETIMTQWRTQLPVLAPRIKEADLRYQMLLDRFQKIGR